MELVGLEAGRRGSQRLLILAIILTLFFFLPLSFYMVELTDYEAYVYGVQGNPVQTSGNDYIQLTYVEF